MQPPLQQQTVISFEDFGGPNFFNCMSYDILLYIVVRATRERKCLYYDYLTTFNELTCNTPFIPEIWVGDFRHRTIPGSTQAQNPVYTEERFWVISGSILSVQKVQKQITQMQTFRLPHNPGPIHIQPCPIPRVGLPGQWA